MSSRTFAAFVVAIGWVLIEAGLAKGASAPDAFVWIIRAVAAFILIAEATLLLRRTA